jgi:tetratricopeptide (TPR) repeat protein
MVSRAAPRVTAGALIAAMALLGGPARAYIATADQTRAAASPSASPSPSPSAEELVREGFGLAYNLDHDEAVAKLTQSATQFPSHAATQRALATVTWLHLLFTRGAVLVDDYLGPVSRQNVKVEPPPAQVASTFQRYITRALTISEQRVAAAPNDASAHYELGAALGLQASYAATIEGRVMGAFGAARRAYNEHERVLALAPSRKEAGLIVGTYRYLVASLSLPLRWMAYVAGFGGDQERGIKMIEEAANTPNEAQTDARFTLVLLYNRERQYDLAMKHVRALQAAFPRNRLIWLEGGSTLFRAGRFADAETMLSEGLTRFQDDKRPRMAGEAGLWYYKRGAARVRLKRQAEARADLQHALTLEAREWVRARMHLELGKLADLAGDRQGARAAYDSAIRIATAAQDASALEEANRLKGAGYKG